MIGSYAPSPEGRRINMKLEHGYEHGWDMGVSMFSERSRPNPIATFIYNDAIVQDREFR